MSTWIRDAQTDGKAPFLGVSVVCKAPAGSLCLPVHPLSVLRGVAPEPEAEPGPADPEPALFSPAAVGLASRRWPGQERRPAAGGRRNALPAHSGPDPELTSAVQPQQPSVPDHHRQAPAFSASSLRSFILGLASRNHRIICTPRLLVCFTCGVRWPVTGCGPALGPACSTLPDSTAQWLPGMT